jgi:hypothetical protein
MNGKISGQEVVNYEEITFKKTGGSTTTTDLANLGIFLYNFIVVGGDNTRAN